MRAATSKLKLPGTAQRSFWISTTGRSEPNFDGTTIYYLYKASCPLIFFSTFTSCKNNSKKHHLPQIVEPFFRERIARRVHFSIPCHANVVLHGSPCIYAGICFYIYASSMLTLLCMYYTRVRVSLGTHSQSLRRPCNARRYLSIPWLASYRPSSRQVESV